MVDKSKKLLLIACSNRKIRTKGMLPAIARYDGGTYRVIHKLQRDGRFPLDVDVVILSAKFGLIDAQTLIPHYDQRLDKKRAAELRPQVLKTLQDIMDRREYSEIYLDLGKGYLPALNGFFFPPKIKVTWASGRIGQRLSHIKHWLLGELQ